MTVSWTLILVRRFAEDMQTLKFFLVPNKPRGSTCLSTFRMKRATSSVFDASFDRDATCISVCFCIMATDESVEMPLESAGSCSWRSCCSIDIFLTDSDGVRGVRFSPPAPKGTKGVSRALGEGVRPKEKREGADAFPTGVSNGWLLDPFIESGTGDRNIPLKSAPV